MIDGDGGDGPVVIKRSVSYSRGCCWPDADSAYLMSVPKGTVRRFGVVLDVVEMVLCC